MKRLLLCAVAIFGLSAPVLDPVEAKPERSNDSADDVRRILEGYAECLVDSEPRSLHSILLADPNSGRFERWRRQLAAQCMLVPRETFYVNPDNVTLRMVLADKLVRKLGGALTLQDVATVPPLVHPTAQVHSRGSAKGAPPFNPRFAFMSRLGECIVRANPTAAAELLQSVSGSEDEMARVQKLLPSASSCLAGRRLQIDALSLRGIVALNYLRMAKRSPPAMSQAGTPR